MNTATTITIQNLAAHGPRRVHWTVLRDSLLGWDFAERDGFIAYDGEIQYVTQKGLDYVRSLNDRSYFDF